MVNTAPKTLLDAKANSDQAQAQLLKARTQQGNTVLSAPSAGTITAREAQPGHVVNPGQKVISRADDAGQYAVFNACDGVDPRDLLGDTVMLNPSESARSDDAWHDHRRFAFGERATGLVVLKSWGDGAVPDGLVFDDPVIGRLTLPQVRAITLRWTALTAMAGGPAV